MFMGETHSMCIQHVHCPALVNRLINHGESTNSAKAVGAATDFLARDGRGGSAPWAVGGGEGGELGDNAGGGTPAVERLRCPPCPLDFLRHFVSPNGPCIISNAISHWPALSHNRWTNAYLSNALRHSTVSLHLTPSGRADALAPISSSSSDLCFACSHVERMLFPDALSHVIASSNGGGLVAYAQEHNNCFISEYCPLVADVETHIPWETEALGCLPEAVNLWIGNHLPHTSFHKDHYENLYAVLSGEKHFLLLPPTDVHRMYINDYPSARYHYSKVTQSFFFPSLAQCSLEDIPKPR